MSLLTNDVECPYCGASQQVTICTAEGEIDSLEWCEKCEKRFYIAMETAWILKAEDLQKRKKNLTMQLNNYWKNGMNAVEKELRQIEVKLNEED